MRQQLWWLARRSTAILVGWLSLVSGPVLAEPPLRLATTTSTVDSGLLDRLFPVYEQQTGQRVDVIAVGTGKAIKLGEAGDVDVLLVHAPAAEEAFVAAGFGVQRYPLMYNDFVFVGPPADPAGLAGCRDGADALRRIAAGRHPFVSRGDASGTHLKEQELWQRTGLFGGRPPEQEPWYLDAGQGMGEVLRIAFEKQAYTLADRGTYLALRDKLGVRLLCAGDPALRNPYALIPVNPARHPHAQAAAAQRFIDWFRSPATLALIRHFQVSGEPLFQPLPPEAVAPTTPVVPGAPPARAAGPATPPLPPSQSK